MKIDAHQHYWKIDRGDYGWLTPAAGMLYRDFLPAMLAPELEANGIEGTIAVQAAPTIAETEYLLRLCEEEKTLIGVVGWLDLASEGFELEVNRLRQDPHFVGIRPSLHCWKDDSGRLKPEVLKSLKLLERLQCPLDLLLAPSELPFVIRTLQEVPDVRAVIDHLANPDLVGDAGDWSSNLSAAAQFPNIYCKLSGMATMPKPPGWRNDQLAPYVRHAMDVFGPDRVMFGSDWPICLQAGSYGEVMSLLSDMLPHTLSGKQRENIFGGNAATFYRIGVVRS